MKLLPLALLSSLLAGHALCAQAPQSRRFDFGARESVDGCIPVSPDDLFEAGRGHGLEPGSTVEAVRREGAAPVAGDLLCGNGEPFQFSVALPEGNYRVRVQAGDPAAASSLVVKAETRRLMTPVVNLAAGERQTLEFTVNLRTPRLLPPPLNAPGLTQVQLNDRERGAPHWDEKLTLEFCGPRACVAAVEIEPAPEDCATAYLIGDSTVTDQPGEPAAGWGQMLPRFFGPGLAVANHAESGETLKSFMMEGRLAKVLEGLRAGDFLLVQFGHNDSKRQWPQTYAEATTTYAAYLRAVVAEARLRGAQPVLVTSMHRRKFDPEGRVVDTHGAYPEAVRAVGLELAVPVVDLHRLSAPFYESLGVERSALAFTDGTHHSNYGGYQLARIVAAELRRLVPGLARFLRSDAPVAPVIPEDPEVWNLPASRARQLHSPRGN